MVAPAIGMVNVIIIVTIKNILKKEGIPVMFVGKKSKNKRTYIDMELL